MYRTLSLSLSLYIYIYIYIYKVICIAFMQSYVNVRYLLMYYTKLLQNGPD